LQTGVTPPHWASDTQFTHVPVGMLHAGIEALQREVLVAEQTPQAPDGWQAGVAPPPQSASPAQARHVWLD
jgi:hypothetical protein